MNKDFTEAIMKKLASIPSSPGKKVTVIIKEQDFEAGENTSWEKMTKQP